VILVVPLKLGCINHAMLTVEAIQNDGLTVAGWVANHPEPETMSCEQETLSYLVNHIPAPCLGILPGLDDTPTERLPARLAEFLNISPLFDG